MISLEKLNQAKQLLANVRTYWGAPPPGRHMPFKEIAAFCGGGIGVYAIISIINTMILSTTNTLIGNTIGIDPTTMYILYILAILAGIPLTALRANIVDNTRSKKGKYRPYILRMGIPAALLSIGFVWMPYEHMSLVGKSITVLLFNIGFQFFFNFFRDSYENLIYVMSSNSQERADVSSIKALVYSLAPSIITPLMPLLAGWICNGDLNDIRLYRYAYPPIAVIGLLLSIIVYANSREKIIQARSHVIQIKFMDALKAVFKNKYFWIISLAGWIGFLESSYMTIMYWMYQYQDACTPGQYAVVTLVYNNASMWGMILSPFAIRRFGKKRVLIGINLLNIVFIGLLYPAINNIWLVLVFMFLNAVFGAFAHVLTPAIEGDIRDYQQYVTGERIDGMFAAVKMISDFFTMVSSGVLPIVYRSVGGIYEGNGFANPYDTLYDPAVFTKLIHVLILLAVFGAAMNVLPYFFYDLTEVKQRGIVRVLQIRALFEDYGNDVLADDKLVEAIDLIHESESYVAEGTIPVPRDEVDRAKGKAAKKAAKKACREAAKHNQMVEVSQFVMEELRKFDQPYMQKELALAQEVVDKGLDSLSDVDGDILRRAKALPKDEKDQKKVRGAAIDLARKRLASQKLIRKNYPDGVVAFDASIFDTLFDREDELDAALDAAYKAYFALRDQKDSAAAKEKRQGIQQIKQDKNIVRAQIKQATNQNSLYQRTVKPYTDAHNLLLQAKNYRRYDEIAAQYEQAKQRADDAMQKQKADAEEKKRAKAARK